MSRGTKIFKHACQFLCGFGKRAGHTATSFSPVKAKSTSHTAEQFSRNVILLIVSVVALCLALDIALADSCIQQTSWTATSGDWFNGTNWSAGVRNSSKSAQINNGGTATIGSTGAVSCDLTLGGGSATQSGTLVVNHGSLNSTFDDAVGGYGKGTLTITNGGTVTAALAAVAAAAGSNGAVTVDGTNSHGH